MKDEVKRTEMVVQGAEQLFTAESSIKVALCDTAELISRLSRMSGEVSVMIGQEAFEEAAATLTALTSARGAIVRAHSALDIVKTQLGCGAVAVGPTQPKPPTPDSAIMIQPPRRVA